MPDSFAERRRWFDAYGASGGAKYRVSCPCCGYLTLSERDAHDICDLCHWQDDGQDDAAADQTWGGPNASLSLAEARRRFARHSVQMSYAAQEECLTLSVADLQARLAMIAAFEAMPSASLEERTALWQQVEACVRLLA